MGRNPDNIDLEDPRMMFFDSMIRRLTLIAACVGVFALPGLAQYQVTNLVSSGQISAVSTDPDLIDGWGLSRSSSSPWWVADALSGNSSLYSGTGTIAKVFPIPGRPTGTVFNGTTSFQVAGTAAHFLFASLDGTISGWNGGASGVVEVTNPGASYTGLAMGMLNGAPVLYAANFASGNIDVYDGNFNRVTLDRFAFQVPYLPPFGFGRFSTAVQYNLTFPLISLIFSQSPRYAPYNIQNIGGTLYVAYAQVNPSTGRAAPGTGWGYVLAFDTTGKFITALQYGSWFNAPWGVALAPSDFGVYAHCVLVGNFGDGTISAFNAASGAYLGKLTDTTGANIAIDGLWGIGFGNGGTAGPLNTLYFAAGPDHEMQGLFGSITATVNTLGGDQ
jgi:uncharacterized protein (TIGR03118 family)